MCRARTFPRVDRVCLVKNTASPVKYIESHRTLVIDNVVRLCTNATRHYYSSVSEMENRARRPIVFISRKSIWDEQLSPGISERGTIMPTGELRVTSWNDECALSLSCRGTVNGIPHLVRRRGGGGGKEEAKSRSHYRKSFSPRKGVNGADGGTIGRAFCRGERPKFRFRCLGVTRPFRFVISPFAFRSSTSATCCGI